MKPFCIMLLASLTSGAQGQPAFEVASVKPVPPSPHYDMSPILEKIDAHPGNVVMKNVRIRTCIKWAYDLKNYEISGVDRLAIEHYNISAKAEEGTPVAQLRIMMQTLLAGRFKLAFHREAKEVRAYELVAAKSGAKLHESETDGEAEMDARGVVMSFKRMPISEFADFLSMPMHAPVIDKTGLKGRFDFNLDESGYESRNPEDQLSALRITMEKQLGLIFESLKTPIQIFVVDHVEKTPTEN